MLNLNPTLTAAGLALFSGQSPNVKITNIAFGAQKYDPDGTETALRAELARYPVDGSTVITNSIIQVGVLMKNNAPDGKSPNNSWIGEIGFFVGTTLFAVLSHAQANLFYKTPDIDIPLTYILDFSLLPPGSVTVNNDALSESISLAASYAQTAAKTSVDTLAVIKNAYYGTYALGPATRPNETPRQKGDRYYDTSVGAEMTWNGNAWFVPNIDASRLAEAWGSSLIGHGYGTVASKLGEIISVSDENAIGDGVTDASAAIFRANKRAGNKPLHFIGTYHVAVPTTITAPIVDTLEQIFTETSQVTIDNGLPVRPEWFGLSVGSVRRAIKALPAKGGIVDLRLMTYPHNGWRYGYNGPGEYIDKPVWLRGSKMPSPSTNCQRFEGGTIIQGMVLAYADNVMFSDLGVDSGLDVCNEFFGGVAQEGLLRTYPDNASKAASLLRKGGGSHNVAAMTKGPLEMVHAMILSEGHTGCRVSGDCIAYYGYHGAVCKGNDLTFDSIHAYMNGGEGFIAKTDAQATSATTNLYGNSVKVYANGPAGTKPHSVAVTGMGVMMNAQGGSLDTIQIGSIQSDGHPIAFGLAIVVGYSVVGMQIGQIRTSNNSTSGVDLTIAAGALFNYSSIGSIISTITPIALNVASSQSAMKIGGVYAKTCGVAAQLANAATLVIGDIVADTCTYGAVRYLDSARCTIGNITALGCEVFATDPGLSPKLLNSWKNALGGYNEVYGIDYIAGSIRLRGLITGGTTNQIGKLPFFALPSKVQRFSCMGMASGVVTSVLVTVDTSGMISVNEYGGGIGSVSGWLSLDCTWSL